MYFGFVRERESELNAISEKIVMKLLVVLFTAIVALKISYGCFEMILYISGNFNKF